jgi:hypothetical protein
MSNVKNALDSFAFDVVDDAKRELQRKKKNASKTLSDSLDYNLNVSKNSFALTFTMEDYGEFIDRGVKGAGGTKADGSKWKRKRTSNISLFKKGKGFTKDKPPADKFSKWSQIRGIRGRNKKTGRFTTRKSLSFAIAKSVFHQGIEGTNFFSKPFNKRFKELPDDLVEAFALDVDKLFNF